MRKITAIAVALGFLTSVSLPAFATPTAHGVVKTHTLAAKKKKKDDKKSALVTDFSAKKKKKDTKASARGTNLSAKKKKKTDDKKAEILYRVAA